MNSRRPRLSRPEPSNESAPLAGLQSPLPGLFVTGTDTGVGKTVVTAAIAEWFRRRGIRVAVLKPVASGCVHRREGWVSEDAELLAVASDTPHPLDLICPNRYAEPLSPNVAADRAGVPVDWDAVRRSIRIMSQDADVLLVEGAGGIMVPIDAQYTMLDLAAALGLPTVIVARPSLGTINHTVLTAMALRQRGVRIAGVVVNGYPAETPGVAEETNPRQIEKWARTSVLSIVPQAPITPPHLPAAITAAVEPVDWSGLAGVGGSDAD